MLPTSWRRAEVKDAEPRAALWWVRWNKVLPAK